MTTSADLGSLDVTKTVYTTLDFLNWQRDGQLDLRPYFQRGSVWTPKARSYLIDTLLRGYPVPIIFLQNRVDDASLKNVRQVVDGQQRLRTILAFIDIECILDADERDNFKILRSHNPRFAGYGFSDLPPDARSRITGTEFSVHVLPSELADKHLLELFARLNSTGDKLNDQELRNAEFHGEFKTTSYDLAYAELDRWREWRTFNPRALAQMKEVELTSELMLFIMRGLQAKTKASIDKAYREFDDSFEKAEDVSRRFSAVFDTLARVFEPDSRYAPYDVFKSQSWIYALFAFIHSAMIGSPLESTTWESGIESGEIGIDSMRRGLNRAADSLRAGRYPDELLRALRGASTDRSSRQARYDFLVGHLL